LYDNGIGERIKDKEERRREKGEGGRETLGTAINIMIAVKFI
jgi:hypothetical protein